MGDVFFFIRLEEAKQDPCYQLEWFHAYACKYVFMHESNYANYITFYSHFLNSLFWTPCFRNPTSG